MFCNIQHSLIQTFTLLTGGDHIVFALKKMPVVEVRAGQALPKPVQGTQQQTHPPTQLNIKQQATHAISKRCISHSLKACKTGRHCFPFIIMDAIAPHIQRRSVTTGQESLHFHMTQMMADFECHMKVFIERTFESKCEEVT